MRPSAANAPRAAGAPGAALSKLVEVAVAAGASRVVLWDVEEHARLATLMQERGVAEVLTGFTHVLRERPAAANLSPPVVAARMPEAFGPADVVVLAPSGFEGAAVLRSRVIQAAEILAPDGRAVVLTHQKRGARLVQDALAEVFAQVLVVVRGWGGYRVFEGSGPRIPADHAEDVLQVQATIAGRRFTFESTTGLFSAREVDPGSRLLVESVRLRPGESVLDFGAGYGPIGIALAAICPDVEVTLLDYDAVACEMAARNAERSGVGDRVSVLNADGVTGSRRYDVVVSHFPIHVPLAAQQRLVHECRAGLRPRGRMVTVSSRKHGLDGLLEAAFGSVREIGISDDYVVLEARDPRSGGTDRSRP